LFYMVEYFIKKQNIIKKGNSSLTGTVKHRKNDWMGGDNTQGKPKMEFKAAPGRDHIFYWNG